MRLDKYLQVSRLVKRRALANRLCDGGRVMRNGRPARASAGVQPGDLLRIDYGWRALEVRVRAVPAGQVERLDATQLYEAVSEERRVDSARPAGGNTVDRVEP